MVRKILITLVMSVFLVLTASSNVVNAAVIKDEKIALEIKKDGTTITIEHLTNYTIDYAVVEYAFIENGVKYSQLTTIAVSSNKFKIDASWYAIKVHQIKTLQNRVFYTYAALDNGKNVIGSFTGVTRRNLVEIETTATNVRTLVQSIHGSSGSHIVYEFYFDFNEAHDELLEIDVHYIMKEPYLIFFTKEREYEKTVKATDTHSYFDYGTAKTIKLLEENSNQREFDGDYVVRVQPGTSAHVGTLKNFAILRILYKIEGEFILADVINDPITPEQGDIDWLLDLIGKIKNGIENGVKWWTENESIVIKILIGVGVVLLWGVLSPVFKILWFVIKMFFKGIKGIFDAIVNVLAWVFS